MEYQQVTLQELQLLQQRQAIIYGTKNYLTNLKEA